MFNILRKYIFNLRSPRVTSPQLYSSFASFSPFLPPFLIVYFHFPFSAYIANRLTQLFPSFLHYLLNSSFASSSAFFFLFFHTYSQFTPIFFPSSFFCLHSTVTLPLPYITHLPITFIYFFAIFFSYFFSVLEFLLHSS